jgi:hypothetical protein
MAGAEHLKLLTGRVDCCSRPKADIANNQVVAYLRPLGVHSNSVYVCPLRVPLR